MTEATHANFVVKSTVTWRLTVPIGELPVADDLDASGAELWESQGLDWEMRGESYSLEDSWLSAAVELRLRPPEERMF
jgi:hypothetical protein